MSIFFVTDHDVATKCNYSVALMMDSAADQKLMGPDASAEALRLELSNHRGVKTAFLMSHGKPTHIVDNFSRSALEISDSAMLDQWRIFAWACWTSCKLGYHIGNQGVIWWGYDCKITAPDIRPEYVDLYVGLFNFVKSGFAQASTSDDVLDFINDLKNEVDLVVQELDVLTRNEPPHTILSLYSCCEQLWKALRVWMNGAQEPLLHPYAPVPYIDI
jgi:hypothetical protein